MTETAAYSLATNKTFCNYCPGYCCYRLEGASLYLDAIDINRIGRYFQIRDGEVRRLYLEGKNTFRTREDGSCIFLDNQQFNRRCTIHPARPRQCRQFPYDRPCPYLEDAELLEEIQPRIERQLRNWLSRSVAENQEEDQG
ncbi:YkgJ family cysteine cluster protein [Desulfogranum mediterraneum]|uniref:YkgJ family cysteine cluster protein n=1 Tax=Desulfogranum mediterraneum TaxID=160661 RepID=UPI00041FD3BB|nr:YkgJ family cysteine cluster protein [Desulfogranum mediterraneum]